mmetsp:Transcript_26971/g.23813  ORF Transcript_26971/g.23813 Transcript_26971/m.23813 type:complete len:116 (-) Transcript_26971:28-375(-)
MDIDKKKAKMNKVRKIPDPKEITKTPTTSKQNKVVLNPSINFEKGVAPALLPSMLSLAKRNQKCFIKQFACPNTTVLSHHKRRRIKSPVNIRSRGMQMSGGIFTPPSRMRTKKLF